MQLSKIKTIAYWFTTGLLALDLLAGGAFSFVHPAQTLSVLQHLGLPSLLCEHPWVLEAARWDCPAHSWHAAAQRMGLRRNSF